MLVGKKRFEFQEHVADEIVIAYGTTVEEAFENAALGLFEVMTDTNTVEPNHEDVFEVEGFDEIISEQDDDFISSGLKQASLIKYRSTFRWVLKSNKQSE